MAENVAPAAVDPSAEIAPNELHKNGAKTGPKLTKEQRATIEELAWRLRTENGASHRQIAEAVKSKLSIDVDRSTISRMLQKSTEGARRAIAEMAVQTIYEQSAQADHIIYLALAEFRKTKQVRSKEGLIIEIDADKDPAWLNTALKAMDHKARIQGAYVEKIELTGANGGPVALDDARSDLARRLAAHAAARAADSLDKPA